MRLSMAWVVPILQPFSSSSIRCADLLCTLPFLRSICGVLTFPSGQDCWMRSISVMYGVIYSTGLSGCSRINVIAAYVLPLPIIVSTTLIMLSLLKYYSQSLYETDFDTNVLKCPDTNRFRAWDKKGTLLKRRVE